MYNIDLRMSTRDVKRESVSIQLYNAMSRIGFFKKHIWHGKAAVDAFFVGA